MRSGIQALGSHFLLIAMTIQGITPDPSDLASSRILRLLSGGAQSAVFYPEDGMEPCEVSRLVGVPDPARIRCRLERADEVGLVPITLTVGEIGSSTVGAPDPHETHWKSSRLVYLLGHLLCSGPAPPSTGRGRPGHDIDADAEVVVRTGVVIRLETAVAISSVRGVPRFATPVARGGRVALEAG